MNSIRRRISADGESSPLTGKLFCADCGGKMYYRRAGERAGRNWRGLPDKRYEMLSSDYEKEQKQIEISMKKIREQLAEYEESTDRTEEFLSLVHKYTDIQELTAPIINEFADRVLVHKAQRIDEERVQEIEVYLNFIGKVELPVQELSEKELAEMKEKQRICERNAMYQRRHRAKFMPKTKAILTEADGAEKERDFAEAQAQAEERLK